MRSSSKTWNWLTPVLVLLLLVWFAIPDEAFNSACGPTPASPSAQLAPGWVWTGRAVGPVLILSRL